MACLNEKPDIGIHKADSHGNIFAVRENSASISTALLDEAENIIPSKNKTRVKFPTMPLDKITRTGHN